MRQVKSAVSAAVAGVVVSVFSSTALAIPYSLLATSPQLRNSSVTQTNLSSTVVDNTGATPIAYSLVTGGTGVLPSINTTTSLGGVPSTSTIFTFPAAASGQLFDAGTSLLFADTASTSNRRILRVTKSSPAASTYVSHNALNAYRSSLGVTTGNTTFAGASVDSAGEFYFGETSTNTVVKTTGIDSLSTVFTRVAFRAFPQASATSTINGLTVLPSGIVVFGDNVTGGIFSYNPTTTSFSRLLSSVDITSGTGVGDSSFVNTAMFYGTDGLVYFYNNGSGAAKSIAAFNPASPVASLKVLVSNAELLGAPATSTQVFGFTNFLGVPAYYSISGTSPGLYAIPEPTTLGLLAPVAALVLRRNRRA